MDRCFENDDDDGGGGEGSGTGGGAGEGSGTGGGAGDGSGDGSGDGFVLCRMTTTNATTSNDRTIPTKIAETGCLCAHSIFS